MSWSLKPRIPCFRVSCCRGNKTIAQIIPLSLGVKPFLFFNSFRLSLSFFSLSFSFFLSSWFAIWPHFWGFVPFWPQHIVVRIVRKEKGEVYPSIYPSVCLLAHTACLPVGPPFRLRVCLSVCLSIVLFAPFFSFLLFSFSSFLPFFPFFFSFCSKDCCLKSGTLRLGK